MQPRQQIAKWLNENERESPAGYDAGLMLFYAHGKDAGRYETIKMFRRPAVLFDALRQLYQDLKDVAKSNVSVDEVAAAVSAPSAKPAAEAKGKTIILQKLEKKWKHLRAQSGAWHAEMRSIGRTNGRARQMTKGEKDQRAQLAILLMDAEREIRAIYVDIEHVEIHGKLPQREHAEAQKYVPGTADKKNLQKRISAINNQIALATEKMNTLKPLERSALKKQIARWEATLAEKQALLLRTKTLLNDQSTGKATGRKLHRQDPR